MDIEKKEIENFELGSRVALQNIVQLFGIAMLKFVAGTITGVVVLIADALDNFTDIVTLSAAFIGLKTSEKSADKGFRYGYYKVETLASLIISLIIIYLGIHIFLESFERLRTLGDVQSPLTGVIAVAVGTLVTHNSAKKLKETGEKINSLALINCGKEKENDFLIEFGVLVGIGAGYYKVPYIEGIIGMAISAIILRAGLVQAKEALFFLLDFFDDQKLINGIKKLILKNSKIVTGVRDIRMRRAGTMLFGEAVLDMNPYSEIKEIRSDIKKLKGEIKKKNEYIKDFSLYTSIPEPKKIRVAVPVVKDNGLKSEVANTLEETKAYVFVDIVQGKIGNRFSKKFKYMPTDYEGMASFIMKENTDIIVNNNMHSLLFYNLRHLRHIFVYPNFSNATSVENTVKLLTIDIK